MRKARMAAMIVIAAALLVLWPLAASADPAKYVLIGSQAEIAGEGEDTSVTYTVLNLTDDKPIVTLTSDENACRPSPTVVLEPLGPTEVKFNLAGCSTGAVRALNLKVTTGDPKSAVRLPVKATAPATASDWRELLAFPAAAIAGGLLVFGSFGSFQRARKRAHAKSVKLRSELNLGASWSFKDSWATNVTLVSAVFTGVFGSTDLLKSITGKAQPSAVALATVASAIAVAIIGIAPLILQVCRTRKGETTVIGLLLSAAFAVGAAGGLTWIMANIAMGLVSGGADTAVMLMAVIALVVLAGYGWTSVTQNITMGTVKVDPTGEKEQTARRVVTRVKASMTSSPSPTDDELFEVVYDDINSTYRAIRNSPGDTPSALI